MLALLALTADATPFFMDLGHRYDATIQAVESMPWDAEVTSLAGRHGLSVLNVTWEDTGRYKGSSVGPNISDMTIGVRDANGMLHPMPVFRFDNFNDQTADLRTDEFWLRVGNERGRELKSVTLEDVLKDTREYMHDAKSWSGRNSALWAERDSHVLVSAQACFLPIPKSGEATFTPVIYNYQSSPGNPAVATIVATREGTSMQVIENDGGYMSDVLFFNQDGERAPFTATRVSDWARNGGDAVSAVPDDVASDDAGLNVVLVIQVPLKYREVSRDYGYFDDMMAPMAAGAAESAELERSSDVENAVVGHGEVEGPFEEFNKLNVERDPRFPVRVTVQFYKATSDGNVTDADVAAIRAQIDKVYSSGDYVGSLVTDGLTNRPTEWVEPKATKDAVWASPVWGWHKAM